MNRFGLGFGGWCRSCRFGRGSLSRGLLLTFSRSFFSCINIGINGRLHRGRISRSRLCFRGKTGVSLGFRILRGLIDGVLAGLTEPPTANHQNCRDNDNGDNRNNHIRIHDSSLKSATDTPAPPRGRTTNVRFTRIGQPDVTKHTLRVRFGRIGQTQAHIRITVDRFCRIGQQTIRIRRSDDRFGRNGQVDNAIRTTVVRFTRIGQTIHGA